MNAEQQAVLQLIDFLYSCIDGESTWPSFLHSLAPVFEATVIGITSNHSLQSVVGVDPVELGKYQDYYGGINPWFGRNRIYPDGQGRLSEEVLPLNSYRRTAFYNEWGKKNLVTHAIGGAIRVSPNVNLFLSINRGEPQSPFGEDHRTMVQLLMPHLRRAADLYIKFNALEDRAWVLNALTFPLIIVSCNAVVQWANKTGEEFLRTGRGLYVRDGTLHARMLTEDAALQRLLREDRLVSPNGITGYGGWLRITHVDDGSEIALFLVRPPGSLQRALGLPAALSGFLLFVAEQSVRPQSLIRRLQVTLGLTLAEAALAVELLNSEGIQSAADRLHISRNTAKTQLASVFQKAGVRRQAELVRKILALAVVAGVAVDREA